MLCRRGSSSPLAAALALGILVLRWRLCNHSDVAFLFAGSVVTVVWCCGFLSISLFLVLCQTLFDRIKIVSVTAFFSVKNLSKRLAQRGHAVTFVSTPRNATRLGAVPPELSARVRVVTLELPAVEGLPAGAESTADVSPEKVELLKAGFDGLAAPFAALVVGRSGAGSGEADGFERNPNHSRLRAELDLADRRGAQGERASDPSCSN
ncbi:hypothetical protein C2845_PM03G25570 [Panicum miliaceum]|uniref:Uncharacterized protein n=1 Tax=Panicum miliaceum TaxID=4540 RepID=A0A3L6T775_PANMI|nr:hypothetical protein C2845_PM03G25570 [Panicum miliaceum]